MLTTETYQIVEVLGSLPADKLEEVRDFALFLKARYGTDIQIDESDEWNDEDMRDLSVASMNYGYASLGEDD